MVNLAVAGTAIEKIYGGDFAKGTPADSLEFIILGTPGHDDYHNWVCHQAILSADPVAKVAYFPWDFSGADEVAGRLGVCVVAPVSTAEIHAYKLSTDQYLWFVDLSAWNMSDSTRMYGAYPPALSKSGVCVTTGDSMGKVLGPYGPNVEFVEYWQRNYRSFVLSRVAGKFSFVRRRAAEVFGFELSWQETREICRQLAGPGPVDSLGRRESLCGVINITPSKVDSALSTFFYKRAAGVETENNFLQDFSLLQNYPNPFNSQTTIPFNLLQAGPVRLTVVDILGREVRVLLNCTLSAGNHETVFDAGQLASGVYSVKLQVGARQLTKRITLVR